MTDNGIFFTNQITLDTSSLCQLMTGKFFIVQFGQTKIQNVLAHNLTFFPPGCLEYCQERQETEQSRLTRTKNKICWYNCIRGRCQRARLPSDDQSTGYPLTAGHHWLMSVPRSDLSSSPLTSYIMEDSGRLPHPSLILSLFIVKRTGMSINGPIPQTWNYLFTYVNYVDIKIRSRKQISVWCFLCFFVYWWKLS